MKVILLDKIGKLGNLGDLVNVKPGFGRNFLLPFGKAVVATPKNLEEFEARRAELEQAAADQVTVAQGRQRQLEEMGDFTITANAGEEGKLFGSIGTRDIAETITAAGLDVQKSEIRLPDGAIRETGDYEVNIQFHSDISSIINLHIVAE